MTTIYNREHRCPKCGGSAGTSWEPGTQRLKRRCGMCGFGWTELPLDSKEAQDAIAEQLGRMARGERV